MELNGYERHFTREEFYETRVAFDNSRKETKIRCKAFSKVKVAISAVQSFYGWFILRRSFFDEGGYVVGLLGNLALLLFVGWIFGKVVEQFALPGLVGMLLAGILLGPFGLNILSTELYRLSPALRSFALVIILLRAGLSLSSKDLRTIRGPALGLSIIPCLVEGFTVMVLAHVFLKLGWAEAGLLGFTLAAVSPAVVVPAMLDLHEEGYGKDKQIPAMVLAGATLDDVFAITLFGVFLLFATGQRASAFSSFVLLPWSVAGGLLGGVVFGFVLTFLFRKVSLQGMEKLLVTLVFAVLLLELGEYLAFAGLLGIMVMGLIIREKNELAAKRIARQLSGIWTIAQISLFCLVGAEVNILVVQNAGLLGLFVVGFGLVARGLGVWISLAGTNLNLKERFFCIIAYLPKATVQAAIGGIPLALGLEGGELILAISALAILVSAPLGAIGIRKAAPLLLGKSTD